MRKRNTAGGILRSAIYGIVVGAVGAYGIHVAKTSDRPVPAKRDQRVTTLVTPEGSGNCRKATYSQDTPHLIAASIVRCDSIRGERSGLPPVLEGYQATLRPR
jgi:hypothetical protein